MSSWVFSGCLCLYDEAASSDRQRGYRGALQGGFVVYRKRGSHNFLQHMDGRTTLVPIHGKEIIRPTLMAKILRDCEMTRDEFLEFRK